MTQLGKITEVPLREIWKHEQYDFSTWLAEDENLSELGDLLNLNLVDVETEKFTGSKRCDILCKDERTKKIVLIENQLEATNHDHLGKLITYASGLNASVIVWIVKEAKEEFASAIEWLNNNTGIETSFFLIEIHAIKIGNSLPAPMFTIIEQPNDFSKSIRESSKKEGMNKSMEKRLEFWNMFNEIVEERGKPFSIRRATTDHWYDVSIGSSKCHLSLDLVNKEGYIRINMWIPNYKAQYDIFYDKKNEIETEIGTSLLWQRLDDKNASRISYRIDGLDFDNQENYKTLMNQSIDMVLKFRDAFKKYLLK